MSSPSRVWTYDPPVNSRMLYRWAIEEYLRKIVLTAVSKELGQQRNAPRD